MKNIFKIFGFLFLVFILSSCGKDAKPAIEIYVSAKKSDTYQNITMHHGYISIFYPGNSEGNLQNYSGITVDLDLKSEDNTVLAGNLTHNEGTYIGLNANLSNISVVDTEGDTIYANTLIDAGSRMYGEEFELLPNEQYRIDFNYDIDESIKLQESENTFDTVVEVTVTQL